MAATNPRAAAQYLREAAAKIETALVHLDMKQRPCGECGVRHWENKQHAKIYLQLTDLPHRLRTRATELEGEVPTAAPRSA